ncbi:MAG: WD40 repeat domain-containing protein, partial [Chloroflexota bacterium]
LDGLTGAVVDAEFDANTTRIVAISDDELVIVWQINNSFTPREIPVNPGTLLNRVAFFGDGSRLIAWGTDGQQEVVYNINTGTGATARNFDLIYESLNPAFADDTVRFALTNDSDQLIRYDVANGAALRFERGISFGVDTVGARALNSIGNAIAVVITDGETNQSRLDIFDAGTREARRNLIFENSADMRITALAFSPEGDALLGADGRYLVIWDTASGRQLNRLAGHADDIIDISYSPNSDYVITLSRDGNRRVWDVAPNDPSVVARLTTNSLYEGVVANPALSPDGTEVYFNVGFGINRLNITTGESSPEIAVFDLDYVFFSDTTPLAISIVSTINSLEMWDVTDFDSRIWDTPLGAPAGETMESIGTFSPDSTRIAVVMTNAVRVYDTSRRVTPSSPTLLDRRGLDISAVAFSEDNSTLYGAVNAVDGVETYGIAVWDIETGTRTLVNIPHVNRINALDLSADGTQLLTASTDNTLVLFDLANAQISRRLSGHQGAVNAVQFSREDSVALSASEDGTLILWDLALGEPVRQYISSGNVVGLDVSIDGRLAATTNNSDFVTIWEIQSTDEIATWIRANRTIPVLSAEQCGQFQAACD